MKLCIVREFLPQSGGGSRPCCKICRCSLVQLRRPEYPARNKSDNNNDNDNDDNNNIIIIIIKMICKAPFPLRVWLKALYNDDYYYYYY